MFDIYTFTPTATSLSITALILVIVLLICFIVKIKLSDSELDDASLPVMLEEITDQKVLAKIVINDSD